MEESGGGSRRLAAVMFLDVAGYSAIMSRSEAEALETIRDVEAIVRREIPVRGGRVVKFLGDGTLAEFPTGFAALEASQAVLQALAERNRGRSGKPAQVRIGLHLGELLEKDGDIFGEAVNVAARIHPMAEPNGIALSQAVYAQIKNRLELKGTFLPSRRLKNISDPVSVFLTAPEGASAAWLALRARAFSIGTGLLAVAVLAAAGFWAQRRFSRLPYEQIAFLQVRANEKDPESQRMEKAILEAMELDGPRIRGMRWMDRSGLLQVLYREGIRDLTDIERAESGACLVAAKIDLRFPASARLLRKSDGTWRMETSVTDTEDLSIVGRFSAAGRDPEGLTTETLRQMQVWVDEMNVKEGP
ncbi:MAG: adenylate/guanylate cyclase domain-containing protein [Elusimicrobia bacterium]|nr:adenylate/guanylate cyclase domain-containing protein [Elusimicrobiota bacterium]